MPGLGTRAARGTQPGASETAAELYGAPAAGSATVQVGIPSPSPDPPPGRERLVQPEDVAAVGGLYLTSGPQTTLDLAARLPPARAGRGR